MTTRVVRAAATLTGVVILGMASPALAARAATLGTGSSRVFAVAGGTRPGASSGPDPTAATASVTAAVAAPPATTPVTATVAAAPVVPVAPAPTAAPVPAPPVSTVAGQEATLVIASLGMRLPVVLGGQATIDRGVVAHYEGGGWRPAVAAGAPGTYWLAAHHATHGTPFWALPSIQVGAIIAIDPVGGREIRYQVTSTQVVGTTASNLTVYGPDATTARILLQTCEGGAYRLLVHGVLIG